MTTAADVQSFHDHLLWEKLEELKTNFASSTGRNATDRHTIARVIAVADYVSAYRPISAYLFPSGRLTTANQLANSVGTLIDQWTGWDESAAMVQSTVEQIDLSVDGILATINSASWPALQKESRARAIADSANAFRVATEAAQDGLDASISLAKNELDSMQMQLQVLRDEADSRGLQAEAALREIEEARASHATTVSNELDDLLVIANARATQQREEVESRWVEQSEAYASQVKKSIEQLEADAETGQQLVAYVGDQTQAGGYMKFAQSERLGYRIWVTLGGLTVAATLVYLYLEFAALVEVGSAAQLQTIILKAALSITALGFSGFCFREAGKRQRQSLEARYRALDLLALRPYTSDMDESDRTVLRNLLGQRLFGERPEHSPSRVKENVTTLRLDLADVRTGVETARAAKDLLQ